MYLMYIHPRERNIDTQNDTIIEAGDTFSSRLIMFGIYSSKFQGAY